MLEPGFLDRLSGGTSCFPLSLSESLRIPGLALEVLGCEQKESRFRCGRWARELVSPTSALEGEADSRAEAAA